MPIPSHVPIEFTAQPLYNKGTSTPAVSRTLLQAGPLLDAFPTPATVKSGVVDASEALMKHLIACEEIRERISTGVTAGRAAIDQGRVSVERDRFLQLPGVMNLAPEAESFLHNAKLALADVGRLFGPLHGQAFDHKFQKVRAWVTGKYGSDDPLASMLDHDAAWIERVVNMRNVVDHPNDPAGPLVIKNFWTIQQEPLVIANPSWALGTEDPVDLLEDMAAVIDNILTLYEDVLTDGLLWMNPTSPFTIVEIPEAERDSVKPIRFRAGFKGPLPSA